MARAHLLGLRRALLLLVVLWAASTPLTAAAEEPCPLNPGPQSTVGELRSRLFRDYSAEERPTTPDGQPLRVGHVLLVKQVEGVYYTTADMQVAIAIRWTDPRLVWDRSQYNLWGITVDSEKIWAPEVGVQSHQGASRDTLEPQEEPCILLPAGRVTCAWATAVTTHCTSDYRRWPYDVHNCSFQIGSWQLPSSELYLHDLEIITDLPPGMPWVVKKYDAQMTNNSVGPDGRLYSVTELWVEIIHQDAVMAVTAFAPTYALTLLTLSSLALPASCGERLTLAAVSVVGHSVLLSYLSWWLEGGSMAPRIVLFHRDGIWAAGAALLVLIVGSCLRGARRTAPAWLSAFLGRLRDSPAGGLLLPPAEKEPAAEPAAAAAAIVSQDGDGDGDDADSDVDIGASDSAEAPPAADAALVSSTSLAAAAADASASDAHWWVAASVLVERLGSACVGVALAAGVLQLLI